MVRLNSMIAAMVASLASELELPRPALWHRVEEMHHYLRCSLVAAAISVILRADDGG